MWHVFWDVVFYCWCRTACAVDTHCVVRRLSGQYWVTQQAVVHAWGRTSAIPVIVLLYCIAAGLYASIPSTSAACMPCMFLVS